MRKPDSEVVGITYGDLRQWAGEYCGDFERWIKDNFPEAFKYNLPDFNMTVIGHSHTGRIQCSGIPKTADWGCLTNWWLNLTSEFFMAALKVACKFADRHKTNEELLRELQKELMEEG